MQSGDLIAERYEIIDLIGSGGMGAVYSARHTVSQRVVALKVIHPGISEKPQTVARFKREASAASRVGHPGLVQVLDAGLDEQRKLLYLVMELLEGQTLKQWLATRAAPSSLLSARPFLELFAELLEPLDALHVAGFVHRDLKPENIFLTAAPSGSGRVKVLDFGLTREIDADSETRTGTALGTPHYMAPEQSLSAKDAEPAADVWALGVMLYEGLSGSRPFGGETPNAVLVAACTTPHAPIERRCEWLPRPLIALVDACLTKEPEARLQNAGAVLSALRRALRELPSGADHGSAPILTDPPGDIALLSTLESSSSGDPPNSELLRLNQTLALDQLEDTAPTSEGRSANASFSRERSRGGAWLVLGALGLASALAITWWAFPHVAGTVEEDAAREPGVPARAATPPDPSDPGETAADPAQAVPTHEAPGTATATPGAVTATPGTATTLTATPTATLTPKPGTSPRRAGSGASSAAEKGPSAPTASAAPTSAAPTSAASSARAPRADDEPGFMREWERPR